MVKTIILNGSEIKISGPDGDNAEIHNLGDDTIYASKFANVKAGADNVIAVCPGAIDGLTGTGGTIYLLGTGKAQVNFTDEKIAKTTPPQPGAGEVTKAYVNKNDAETLAAAKSYSDSLNADLSGYIGYTDSDIYGIEADFENCVFTRLAGAVGKSAGADFDGVRAYGGRRRCNLSDGGEVLAYCGDEGFKTDGSNGQVMVEQPRFYYKVVPLKVEKIDGADGYHLRKARYYISDTPKAGFKVHPAFVRGGVEVDRIFLSAFEGCIYDTSAGVYLLNDEQVADFNADKLSSIAGAKPCSGQTQALTRANARKLAHNRGEGWEQATVQAVAATQLLFVIEYAMFDSQTALGNGNVYQEPNPAVNISENTGATAALGNLSGLVQSNGVQIVSYRGEENLWGNIWIALDGINEYISGNAHGEVFISDHNFTDNTSAAPYENSGIVPCYGTGFISSFGYSDKFDYLFIPDEFKGNGKLPVGDYCWNYGEGWRASGTGGGWCYHDYPGIFTIQFNINSNYHGLGNSARLTFIDVQVINKD